MTKILFIISMLFGWITLWCQTTINVQLMDQSTGQPAINQFVAINFYPTSGNPPPNPTTGGVTDQNGILSFGFASNLNGSYTVAKASYDCNNQYIADTSILSLSGGTHIDTMILPCMPPGGLNCNSGLIITPDTTNAMALNITLDTSLLSGLPPNPSFFAGDWTISEENPHFVIDSLYAQGQMNINYVFPGSGTYSVCHIYTYWDTTLFATRPCINTVCDTVTVPFTSYCQASYYLDTNTSNSDVLTVVNTSGPTGSFYANTFFWDFDDGTTSTQAYPTHVFSSAGAYNVCVTIISTDGFQNVCTHTFCDTIGVDSTGQIIYKNGQKGFTLRVIDPNSIGLDELSGLPSFALFPNPAKNKLNLKPSTAIEGKTTFIVYDIYGRGVMDKTVQNIQSNAVITLDVSDLPTGFYLLKMHLKNGQTSTLGFEVLNH